MFVGFDKLVEQCSVDTDDKSLYSSKDNEAIWILNDTHLSVDGELFYPGYYEIKSHLGSCWTFDVYRACTVDRDVARIYYFLGRPITHTRRGLKYLGNCPHPDLDAVLYPVYVQVYYLNRKSYIDRTESKFPQTFYLINGLNTVYSFLENDDMCVITPRQILIRQVLDDFCPNKQFMELVGLMMPALNCDQFIASYDGIISTDDHADLVKLTETFSRIYHVLVKGQQTLLFNAFKDDFSSHVFSSEEVLWLTKMMNPMHRWPGGDSYDEFFMHTSSVRLSQMRSFAKIGNTIRFNPEFGIGYATGLRDTRIQRYDKPVDMSKFDDDTIRLIRQVLHTSANLHLEEAISMSCCSCTANDESRVSWYATCDNPATIVRVHDDGPNDFENNRPTEAVFTDTVFLERLEDSIKALRKRLNLLRVDIRSNDTTITLELTPKRNDPNESFKPIRFQYNLVGHLLTNNSVIVTTEADRKWSWDEEWS